jgi:hypothetical protein
VFALAGGPKSAIVPMALILGATALAAASAAGSLRVSTENPR